MYSLSGEEGLFSRDMYRNLLHVSGKVFFCGTEAFWEQLEITSGEIKHTFEFNRSHSPVRKWILFFGPQDFTG